MGLRAGPEHAPGTHDAVCGRTLMVAGAFGPKMAQALDRKHIERVELGGSVEDAPKKARDHRAGTPQ